MSNFQYSDNYCMRYCLSDSGNENSNEPISYIENRYLQDTPCDDDSQIEIDQLDQNLLSCRIPVEKYPNQYMSRANKPKDSQSIDRFEGNISNIRGIDKMHDMNQYRLYPSNSNPRSPQDKQINFSSSQCPPCPPCIPCTPCPPCPPSPGPPRPPQPGPPEPGPPTPLPPQTGSPTLSSSFVKFLGARSQDTPSCGQNNYTSTPQCCSPSVLAESSQNQSNSVARNGIPNGVVPGTPLPNSIPNSTSNNIAPNLASNFALNNVYNGLSDSSSNIAYNGLSNGLPNDITATPPPVSCPAAKHLSLSHDDHTHTYIIIGVIVCCLIFFAILLYLIFSHKIQYKSE